MLKRSINLLCTAAAYVLILWWIGIFAYANWLRFESPTTPNPATGQIVYEKATRGIFYITEEQAIWAQALIWPVFLLILLAGIGEQLTRTVNGSPRSPSLISRTGHGIYALALIALWLFGDYVMALLFTGTLSLPTGR